LTTPFFAVVVKEVPITTEDVIRILQKYKPAAMKVFHNKVNLYFDREKKEIMFEIPCTGGYYSKKVVYHQLSYKVLGLEELIKPVYILRLVDEWIEALSERQAEAIFWRCINHDFEVAADVSDWRIQFKTLSYEQIAERMGCSPQKVYIHVKKGLGKILKMCNNELFASYQMKPP